MKSAIIWILHAVSKLLNPFGLRVCRFEPSCTLYAKQALDNHPVPAAFGLIARRLLSCRPFGPRGYDPVPEPHRNGA